MAQTIETPAGGTVSGEGSLRLFLILSISNQYRISGEISKEERADLHPAHREYHRSSREDDAVLVKSMIRPAAYMPRGARCMIIRAESKQKLESWMLQNPLMKYGAHEWDIREVTPQTGLPAFFEWLQSTEGRQITDHH